MSISKIRTSDGAEHGIDYEGLENKPAVLGEPIHVKHRTIATALEVNNTITHELDFSPYLPDDGCTYLVHMHVYGTSAKDTNSRFICCDIKTSIHDDVPFGWGREWSTSYSGEIYNFGNIIVGPDRKAWIVPHTSTNYKGTIHEVYLNWYQKVNVIID